MTTNRQQNDTIQEGKKKELRKSIGKHLPLKEEITLEQMGQVAKEYSVSLENIKDLWRDLLDYCESKGESYANYYTTLQVWTRRAIKEKKISVIKINTQEEDYYAKLNAVSRRD